MGSDPVRGLTYPFMPLAPPNGIKETTALTMTKDELTKNQLVQDGQTLYKVSEFYDNSVTASVEYPIPRRTTVHRFTFDQIARWHEPSQALLNAYDRFYGR